MYGSSFSLWKGCSYLHYALVGLNINNIDDLFVLPLTLIIGSSAGSTSFSVTSPTSFVVVIVLISTGVLWGRTILALRG